MSAELMDKLQRWWTRRELGRILYTCDELLRDPAQKQNRSLILFYKGMAQSESGPAWFGQAISSHREGLALAGRDRPLKARHMAALGCIYGDLGDPAAFEKMLKEFGVVVRDKNPEVVRHNAVTWYNYGVALENAFRWEEAAQAYTKAASLARQFDQHHIFAPSLHNLGGVCLYLGHLDKAALAMAEAERHLPDEDIWGAKKLSRRAEYALASGDLISAQQWLTSALLHPAADDRTRADVYLTWAKTLVELGRPEEAQEKALRALDFAVKAVYHKGVHEINQFLKQFGRPR